MTKEEIQAKCQATRLENLLKRKAAKVPFTARDKNDLKKLLTAQPKKDGPKGLTGALIVELWGASVHLAGEQAILRGRQKPMNRITLATLCALCSLIVLSFSASGETFVGTAAATATHKRPLLVVDGKRYELEASHQADASVADMLAKFSQGDTGTYAITGTRGTVIGKEGIVIDSITPSAVGNLVSPNNLSAAGQSPNALSRFSNTQLIILGTLVLGVCVSLCILTGILVASKKRA